MNQKLYIIFGTGPDSVGLVDKITAPISSINGNIIDLRQDVLHGLFTVFMVVDLAGARATVEEVQALVDSSRVWVTWLSGKAGGAFSVKAKR